jgi:hypothetical protein
MKSAADDANNRDAGTGLSGGVQWGPDARGTIVRVGADMSLS